MEVLKGLIKEANMSFNTADHLIYITYPTVKDNKLMIIIIENLYRSLLKGMDAILYYERMYKRISSFSDNFNTKLEVFRTKCVPRYNIDRNFIILINELKQIIEHRKRSPIEFSKRNSFIMLNDDYRIKSITIERLKDYLAKSKIFIGKVNAIFKEDDRRIREY